MMLGWTDDVDGIFEVREKDGDALILHNFFDELTYRTRSNLGEAAFAPVEKSMILVGRLVRAGDDWMVSGNPTVYHPDKRGQILGAAAEHAMSNPKLVFRNPDKLTQARTALAVQHAHFVERFGTDLIVVPAAEAAETANEFYRSLATKAQPDSELRECGPITLPDEWADAQTVGIHFLLDEGLSFTPEFGLIEKAFADPALVVRQEYREALSGHLRDPDASPEPLRRLAAQDPGKASAVFAKLLKKRGFTWAEHGQALLRKHKPSYFDGTRLPRTVVLSDELTEALQKSRR
jgi:hypothetical protein